eukprot:gene3266-4043_t
MVGKVPIGSEHPVAKQTMCTTVTRDVEASVNQEEYDAEVEQIEELFAPLVLKCKEKGRAMRIGTNHGSLSARVMSYWGDSPRGMVESAIEFAKICRKYDYHNFLFSMK